MADSVSRTTNELSSSAIRPRTNWTEEMLAAEAARYQTRNAFQVGCAYAYQAARRRRLLDSICSHMAPVPTVWTNTMLADEAAKFSTRIEFQQRSGSAYQIARRRGLLDQICAHMKPLRVDWSNDMILAEAAKYDTRASFQKAAIAAYTIAYRRGILDTVCAHMTPLRTDWDYDAIAKEALKYGARSAFAYYGKQAYAAAWRNGILDQVCAHMKLAEGGSDNDTIYLWRAEGIQHQGLDVYKIGATSARLDDARIAQVRRASGFVPSIVRLTKVTEKASFLESEFLKFGVDPGFSDFDGCTEFRALKPNEVDSIVDFIDLFADESSQLAA